MRAYAGFSSALAGRAIAVRNRLIDSREGEAIPMENESTVYGCLFCQTGKEEAVAESIHCACPNVLLTPVRQEKYLSRDGKKSKAIGIAIPGYVFFKARNDEGLVCGFPMHSVYQLLRYDDGDWRLRADDAAFAAWLFRYQGILSFSKAYLEGERVQLASGPLKDMEGQVLRIDRRGRSGQIAVHFGKQVFRVWLGFEFIQKLAP